MVLCNVSTELEISMGNFFFFFKQGKSNKVCKTTTMERSYVLQPLGIQTIRPQLLHGCMDDCVAVMSMNEHVIRGVYTTLR